MIAIIMILLIYITLCIICEDVIEALKLTILLTLSAVAISLGVNYIMHSIITVIHEL